GVGNDREVVGAAEIAGAGPRAERADDGELLLADTYLFADRLRAGKERLPRAVAEQHDVAAVLRLGLREHATELHLGEIDGRPVFRGADDRNLPGTLVAVVDARLRAALCAEPHV